MNALRLSRTTLGRLERYAQASGKDVSAVADQAIEYWFENHGEIVLHELLKPEPARPRRKK